MDQFVNKFPLFSIYKSFGTSPNTQSFRLFINPAEADNETNLQLKQRLELDVDTLTRKGVLLRYKFGLLNLPTQEAYFKMSLQKALSHKTSVALQFKALPVLQYGVFGTH